MHRCADRGPQRFARHGQKVLRGGTRRKFQVLAGSPAQKQHLELAVDQHRKRNELLQQQLLRDLAHVAGFQRQRAGCGAEEGRGLEARAAHDRKFEPVPARASDPPVNAPFLRYRFEQIVQLPHGF